jgi:hypothetical protein
MKMFSYIAPAISTGFFIIGTFITRCSYGSNSCADGQRVLGVPFLLGVL